MPSLNAMHTLFHYVCVCAGMCVSAYGIHYLFGPLD